jgi:RNA 2',3'-cyclic 3'-phosphodiesterase
MRLFLALTFPDQARARIHEAAGPLRASGIPIRWLEPDRYHLTLKFLGDVRSDRLPPLEKAVARVAGATRAFTLTLEGFGAFPTIRRPDVIWLGADPTPALRCLKQDLEWGLASHGFERETRAFHPHVTLGRAAVDEGAGAFRGLDELAAGLAFRMDLAVATVDVVRSNLKKQGARYSILRSIPLRTIHPRG